MNLFVINANIIQFFTINIATSNALEQFSNLPDLII